jgi:hypothetical protein
MITESKIRKLVREIIEASLHPHYKERLYDRFLNSDKLYIGYEIPGSRGQYEKLGTYQLTDDEKNKIREKARYIENFNFPRQDDLGVSLGLVHIDPKRANFFTDSDRREAIGKTLVFIDEATDSNGNVIFAIVRGNEIKTIYWGKSYVAQTAEKMDVDRVVKKVSPEKAQRPGKGQRKKIELDLPLVDIDGKEWYVDEENEKIIYRKNIKKELSFDELDEDVLEQVIDAVI